VPNPASHSTPHGIPDEELIRRASSGDHEAFAELVRRYEDTVFNFAFKVCRTREHAEEALQDTFVNVFRKLKQFDRRSKFTTWLYSIVANNCLMKRRQSKLHRASVSLDQPDGDGGSVQIPEWRDTPLHQTMRGELRGLLDESIKKLPMDHRIVFILRDVEGKSAEETGKILDLTVPAVKSRLRRARVFLRNELEEYMKA
jgi:RNA polymerase sigma-70 factor (ECF subfamily)